jgi:hypothetical protein
MPRSPAEVHNQTTRELPKVCIAEIKVLLLRDISTDGASEDERNWMCLRKLAQAYSLVLIKETCLGSLKATAQTDYLLDAVLDLAVTLRDAIVKRAVILTGGFLDEDDFFNTIKPAFDPCVWDAELRAAMTLSYHKCLRPPAKNFRSKCSRSGKNLRPRKGTRDQPRFNPDALEFVPVNALPIQSYDAWGFPYNQFYDPYVDQIFSALHFLKPPPGLAWSNSNAPLGPPPGLASSSSNSSSNLPVGFYPVIGATSR